MKNKIYVQYGCGLEAPAGWLNFDASPTLRIQKLPIVGRILKPYLNCVFGAAVRYGDIIRGLPVADNSVDGVFCSHVLEHLSLDDFHKALDNTFFILKPGGVFRCIVPDLELYIREYISVLSGVPDSRHTASIAFCKESSLGRSTRKRGLVGRLSELYGNSLHRWMWDRYSLAHALREHGFVDVESFSKGQSDDAMFLLPECDYQFHRGFGLQCRKPE